MTGPEQSARPSRVRAVIWVPGLAVALGAAVATAHGLYEVALAAHVPRPIAWLYPLITDGLALVAYAATARLSGPPARYAWTVVVLAAGLSGLAQAVYLAADPTGPGFDVGPALRFGVGAWPAIAAAVVAHLLYLLASESHDEPAVTPVQPGAVQPAMYTAPVQPDSYIGGDVQSATPAGAVQPGHRPDPDAATTDAPSTLPARADARSAPSPARDRAQSVATGHARRHGAWPTVSELEAAAEVSRGTAAAALKTLRERPAPLHLIATGDHQPRDEARP